MKLKNMSNEIIQRNKGGVRTESGKQISKYNAQKHSILRESATDYEKVDYQELLQEVSDDLKPIGRTQEMLVEIIVLNMIKLVRIAKSEAEKIKQLTSKYTRAEGDLEVFKPAHYEYNPSLDYTVEHFDLFARYQTATENRIYRAIVALKQLQNEQS